MAIDRYEVLAKCHLGHKAPKCGEDRRIWPRRPGCRLPGSLPPEPLGHPAWFETAREIAGPTLNTLLHCVIRRELMMRRQPGFFDRDERCGRLSAGGDPLETLNAIIPLPVFEKPHAEALRQIEGRTSAVSGGADVQDPGASGTLQSLR